MIDMPLALRVHCPTCFANRGKPCTTRTGKEKDPCEQREENAAILKRLAMMDLGEK